MTILFILLSLYRSRTDGGDYIVYIVYLYIDPGQTEVTILFILLSLYRSRTDGGDYIVYIVIFI